LKTGKGREESREERELKLLYRWSRTGEAKKKKKRFRGSTISPERCRKGRSLGRKRKKGSLKRKKRERDGRRLRLGKKDRWKAKGRREKKGHQLQYFGKNMAILAPSTLGARHGNQQGGDVRLMKGGTLWPLRNREGCPVICSRKASQSSNSTSTQRDISSLRQREWSQTSHFCREKKDHVGDAQKEKNGTKSRPKKRIASTRLLSNQRRVQYWEGKADTAFIAREKRKRHYAGGGGRESGISVGGKGGLPC